MSWFPKPKFQQEWLDRCFEFDQKMEKLSHLSDEERAQMLEAFNREMAVIAKAAGLSIGGECDTVGDPIS